MSTGRPSTYTPELAARICAEIGEGSKLTDVCQADDMPSDRTVYAWLASKPEFSQQYARAMEERTNAMAEEILEIADESGFDASVVDGRAIVNSEAINRARLRVDTRKWLMSKMAPKKYGDKIEQQHTGPGGGPLMLVTGVPRAGDQDS
jgi:hypothetical protein